MPLEDTETTAIASGFFDPTAAPESLRQQLMEALLHRSDLLLSFPLGTSLVPLYALPVLLGLQQQGVVLVLCPDRVVLERNVACLKDKGFGLPEIASFDGTQMPHQIRHLMMEIQRGRTRLLFFTPNALSTIDLLDIMARVEVLSWIVEDAHRLLGGFEHCRAYRRLLQVLARAAIQPALVLLTPFLPQQAYEKLAKQVARFKHISIDLPGSRAQAPLLPDRPIIVHVDCLWSEYQKWRHLQKLCEQAQHLGEPVVIQVETAQAFLWLQKAFARSRFKHVLPYGPDVPAAERQQAEEAVALGQPVVVLVCGTDSRFLNTPSRMHLVYWQLPSRLETLASEIFRLERQENALGQEPSAFDPLSVLLLYTREDYMAKLTSLAPRRAQGGPDALAEAQERITALKQLRQWVRGNQCRLQSLYAFMIGNSDQVVVSATCGVCDVCTQQAQGQPVWGLFKKLFGHWMY